MREIALKRIFIFWLPLAATWLMMSAEGPFLAAVIARLAEAKYNLAAYGVAFAFALIIESPVIMMLSASTALVRDWQSFCKLRNFTYVLNALLTAVILIVIIPQVFHWITITVMGLPVKVSGLTHGALILLLPWPGAIGFRRFYQGMLIRHDKTRLVAYGTIIRITTMAATALLLYHLMQLPGAWVGGAALSVGVTAEAIASRLMVSRTIEALRSEENPFHLERVDHRPLSYAGIFQFYYPLALTSILGLAIQPLVTFFLGQSRMAVESLAVFPVVNSFLFIFRSMGLSYQEVGITFLGDRDEGFEPLKRFALLLALAVTVLLGLVGFSPLFMVWFHHISGLEITLAEFARLPVLILLLLPAFSIMLAFERAIMVNHARTRPITIATGLEVAIIFVSLTVMIHGYYAIGIIAAAAALMFGRLVSVSYLFLSVKKVLAFKRSV